MSDSQTKSLEYFAKSGEALELAEQLANQVDQEKRAAAQLIPGLVSRLQEEHKLIEAHEKGAAAEQLADHAGALKIVGNLLSAMSEMKAAYEQKLAIDPGKPVPANGKQASHRREKTSSGPYIDRKLGAGEKSAADRVFLERLGLTSLLNQ